MPIFNNIYTGKTPKLLPKSAFVIRRVEGTLEPYSLMLILSYCLPLS